MDALTLKHPWAFCICELGKRVENRSYPPPDQLIGNWLAIHGGKVPTSKREVREVLDTARHVRSKFWMDYIRGDDAADEHFLAKIFRFTGVVAVCRVKVVLSADSEDPWYEGPEVDGSFNYGWVLSDLVVLPEPVPCRGQRRLWPLPDDVLDAVREQYKKAKVKA